MLAEPLTQVRQVHRSLPVLGRTVDAFDDWMIQQGYRFATRQCYILRCTAIDGYFGRRRYSLENLTCARLRQCHRYFRHRPGGISNTVGCLERFLRSQDKRLACRKHNSTVMDHSCSAATRIRWRALIDAEGVEHISACKDGVGFHADPPRCLLCDVRSRFCGARGHL
jgi:hypothetical protein